MNLTPSPEEALRAMTSEYSDRARASTTNGAKSDDFESAAKDYAANIENLHADRAPAMAINREQPVHVLMCYMQASGKSLKEIAEATNYSEGAVRMITKQPWFRKRFLRITADAGRNSVESFLAGETMTSLEVLVEIRDDSGQKGPTRVAAANSILDRALGKAVQKVETENHSYQHKAESGSEIDRQIAAAESELKALGHSAPATGPN